MRKALANQYVAGLVTGVVVTVVLSYGYDAVDARQERTARADAIAVSRGLFEAGQTNDALSGFVELSKTFAPNQDPDDWREVQLGIAEALILLSGTCEDPEANLAKAIVALEEAERVTDPTENTQEYAILASDMMMAYSSLGQIRDPERNYSTAVAWGGHAADAATDAPNMDPRAKLLVWNNVALTAWKIGAATDDEVFLDLGLLAGRAALETLDNELADDSALVDNYKPNVLVALGCLEVEKATTTENTEGLLTGLEHIDRGIGLLTPSTQPEKYADAIILRGIAHLSCSEALDSEEYVKEAIADFEDALSTLTAKLQPQQHASAAENLGLAHALMVARGHTDHIAPAKKWLEEALGYYVPSRNPRQFSEIQGTLGFLHEESARVSGDDEDLSRAQDCYREALKYVDATYSDTEKLAASLDRVQQRGRP